MSFESSSDGDDDGDDDGYDGHDDDVGEVLTTIFDVVRRTMISNQLGFQTSCPTREKVAWTDDTLATTPTLLTLWSGAGAGAYVI